MCVCVCLALPCKFIICSLSYACYHAPTPSPPLPAGCLLLTVKLLAQFSSNSTRLEARRGNISRNMSGCYFYSPSLLALLSFPLASRGGKEGLRREGRQVCAHFSLHISSRNECRLASCPICGSFVLVACRICRCCCNPQPRHTHYRHTHASTHITQA